MFSSPSCHINLAMRWRRSKTAHTIKSLYGYLNMFASAEGSATGTTLGTILATALLTSLLYNKISEVSAGTTLRTIFGTAF